MEIKNFDMYWAFVTGLGVQQDTLGAQDRFFFFGWAARAGMFVEWYWENSGFGLQHASWYICFGGAYILHIWMYLHHWVPTKDTLLSYLKCDYILGSSGQQYVIINSNNWKTFPVSSLTFGFTSTHLPTSRGFRVETGLTYVIARLKLEIQWQCTLAGRRLQFFAVRNFFGNQAYH